MSSLLELQWATVRVPLARPLQAGRLVIRSRDYCCCRVRLESRAEGECYVMTRGLPVGEAVDQLIAPRVMADDGLDQLDRLRVTLRNIGWDGAISRAAALVRLAVLDARARGQGVPIWRYLGASSAPTTAAAIVIGYTTPGETAEEKEVQDAVRAVESGARCLKLMGGFAEPEYDLRRVTRVRDAVGDGVAVGLDVNGAWSLAESRAILPRLLEVGTAFLEEPWAYELGLQGFDQLPEEHPALALGEISASVIELQSLARTEHVRYIRADVTLLGGEQQWLALSETVASTGASLFPHFWPDLHRHLVFAAPTAYIEDLLPGGGEFGLERFVRSEPALADGTFTAPSVPGFGFHLDWEAVDALALTPPTIRHGAGERAATGG